MSNHRRHPWLPGGHRFCNPEYLTYCYASLFHNGCHRVLAQSCTRCQEQRIPVTWLHFLAVWSLKETMRGLCYDPGEPLALGNNASSPFYSKQPQNLSGPTCKRKSKNSQRQQTHRRGNETMCHHRTVTKLPAQHKRI